MRKRLVFLLVLVAMLVTLSAGMGLSASADSSINNILKEDVSNEAVQIQPSEYVRQLMKNSGMQQLPKKSSYLGERQNAYMDNGNSSGAHAYKKPSEKAGTIDNVYQGTAVQVIAVEEDWACVIFHTADNEKKAGWVSLDTLSEEYPGETYRFGKIQGEDGTLLIGVVPELKWSNFNFVDTKIKYSTIEQPVCEYPCVSLILDYQVTSRNGVKKAYGERDIYVNSGDGWEYVGSFEVEEDFAPVRCEINFEEPTIVKAVAAIPVDASAETFVFRQAIEYMYFEYKP